ncbi:LysR family transcriptional regulator [Rhodovulum adriaticum]|uniref:LysR family transcriptional regulator n=1 Tax=Rhodovulum adriaticum TaxID=35804 RepID=A0A4R2NKN5_RHOAD|nr:LysR family transcriptional regulator [Rhodovulum adriaticum]MBK1635505.1 LysR family transcriptional regulator [Rhodovulum adriaticum]TCP22077.1 LysR family transcriptional regulator [Rhodovulum adriaticum]
MSVETWDEIRTAYHVARRGTVSGAAEDLGVHHATVIRHVDALEARLGVKLFQRHARGYTPTEAGEDLLRVAQITDDQFTQLAGRLKGQRSAMTGELTLTTVDALAPLLVPVLAGFQVEHPDLSVRLLADARLFRLEYGEAHVAVRAGGRPDEPDNIVQELGVQRTALFAHRSYVQRRGPLEDFAAHDFVGHADEGHRAPFNQWLAANVPGDRIRFRASDARACIEAVQAGAGIGFVPLWRAAGDPDLVEMHPPLDEWAVSLWLVTHVDLHRSAKVQALTARLKEAAQGWP